MFIGNVLRTMGTPFQFDFPSDFNWSKEHKLVGKCLRSSVARALFVDSTFTSPETMGPHCRWKPFLLNFRMKQIKPKHKNATENGQDRDYVWFEKPENWIHFKSNLELILSLMSLCCSYCYFWIHDEHLLLLSNGNIRANIVNAKTMWSSALEMENALRVGYSCTTVNCSFERDVLNWQRVRLAFVRISAVKASSKSMKVMCYDYP